MKIQTYKLFKPNYSALDYDSATQMIIQKATARESFGVSALAVHGLITSIQDPELGGVINKIDLIVPDGQPVRWALNSFYKLSLKDRVYGPKLTLEVLKVASDKKLKVFLYGSTEDTLNNFKKFIEENYKGVILCGIHVDRFREATDREDEEDVAKINKSGANIVLVGRGCPRQEFWVARHKDRVHAAMMAVGAAFDFHAGTVSQAPKWMQDNGLEWFYRLLKEPKRLWRRYLITNSLFIFTFFKYKYLLRRPY